MEVFIINHKTRRLLSNNIVYLRHKKNWSQEMLAEKMGSSSAYISQLENAKRNVTTDFFDKIADTFNVAPFELLIERDIINNKRIDRKK